MYKVLARDKCLSHSICKMNANIILLVVIGGGPTPKSMKTSSSFPYSSSQIFVGLEYYCISKPMYTIHSRNLSEHMVK